MDFIPMRDFSEFCDQLNEIRLRFHKWDSCEQTVALYYLMGGLPFSNARFLQHILEHCIAAAATPELMALERNANDPAFISNLLGERMHVVLAKVLSHLPLLRPGNREAAICYLSVIRKVLGELMAPPCKIYNDCIEIMSYVFVHPAFDKEEKKSFKQLLKQMVNKACPESLNRSPVNEQSSDESTSPHPEPVSGYASQLEAAARLGRRSNSLTPAQTSSHESLQVHENWSSSQENLSPTPHKPRSYSLSNDKCLPISLQPLTSSSSETRLQDLQTMSNLPIMKGIVVWLKSLRLHKYSWVFTNLTYDQMLNLTEERLQAIGITKGARHKLLLSINKLRERSMLMTELETEVMNGGDLLAALKKLKGVLQSPLQVTAGEDLPTQFVKVMGKVCTQLLMLRQPQEECLSLFTGMCEKAETLEAFNADQKRRLSLWKGQLIRGTSLAMAHSRQSSGSNNHIRPFNAQTHYYAHLAGPSYQQQVYGQKSSSYPNVQGNQVVGAHRNSLGNINTTPIGVVGGGCGGGGGGGGVVGLSAAAPAQVATPHFKLLIRNEAPPNHFQNNYKNYSNGNHHVQVRFQPAAENDDRKAQRQKNVDIESSLESLCLQMMEHALGP